MKNNYETSKNILHICLENKIRLFYEEHTYIESTKRGARAVPRFHDLTLMGKEYFNHEN